MIGELVFVSVHGAERLCPVSKAGSYSPEEQAVCANALGSAPMGSQGLTVKLSHILLM